MHIRQAAQAVYDALCLPSLPCLPSQPCLPRLISIAEACSMPMWYRTLIVQDIDRA